MNYYNRIRQHYKDLPELPDPDSNLNDWNPVKPQDIKDRINGRNVMGYVDQRIRNRLDQLIEEAKPPLPTPEEIAAQAQADFEQAKGPVCRIIDPNSKYCDIAWNAVEGWTPERYQVMGRSIARWGRDCPVEDDIFGTWKQKDTGEWYRDGIRQTWTAMGGYDPAIGPYKGACAKYYVKQAWLDGCGDGPWQIAVAAHFDGKGWVYGPIIEWPKPKGNIVPKGQEAPKDHHGLLPPTNRKEYIYNATSTYSGKRTKDGRPYLRQLRKHAGIKDITSAERNQAYKDVIKNNE